MKGKIFLFVFALPFFGVGVWMLYSTVSDFHDAWQMRNWLAVEATLTNAGYSTHHGDDSTTYEAYATYSYSLRGMTYSNDRVGLSGGADNIGSYQTRIGSRLRDAWSRGQAITVYVDPEDPRESIIDRDIRWGMIGFRSIFVFAFGGVGLGLMIFAIRAPRKKDLSDPAFADSPWLANDDWQGDAIRSNSKAAMYVTWGFAAFWNLISAPLPFVIYEELLEKQNYLAAIGLLFPLVGVGLIVWAVRQTREWTRFGPTPVTLDPFPGAIGGHVGGTFDVRLPYDPGLEFKVTLTSIDSYVSGSGKSRSRKEKADWQDSQYAHVEPGADGTRVVFRFEVPDGLDEASADRGRDRYHLWRLNLTAELPGADLDRDFDIPVYATAATSASLPERAMQNARVEQDRVDEAAVRERIRLDYGAGGKVVRYPMGRNAGSAIGGFVIGSIFAGVGWYLMTAEGERVFGAVFGSFGALIAVFTLYLGLNSLQVTKEAGMLRAVRRVLGVRVGTGEVPVGRIARFTKDSRMQTHSGNSHVMHYSIYAHGDGGEKVCVGEGFRGAGEADAAIRLLCREFGLTPREPLDAVDAGDDFDALAADG